MRTPASAFYVPEARLKLSRAASVEIAAAALAAQREAGLETASFIVIAVDPAIADPEAARAAAEAAAAGA